VRPLNFLRELSRRHEITMLATAGERETEGLAEVQPYCRHVRLVPLRLTSSLRRCAEAAIQGKPLQAAVCQSSALDQSLAETLAEERFDLVHIEHLRAVDLSARIPAELPKVFDSVDCISLLLERTLHSSYSAFQRLVAALELHRTRAYEARVLRRFEHVTVTSADDARALNALEPEARISVVSNGVDLEYFEPLEATREHATLVYLGKMSYHANATAVQYFAREILPLVRQRRPDARLRIVGSKPTRAVRALANDPGVEVTGFVPDIREPLGRASVAICPVTVKVGVQNKVLEAMAMGVPVVSTRLGVEGLQAEPGRDLLVARTPAEFAAEVERLLSDPSLREQIGRAGRRYVETHHRWDSATRRLETLYQDAVERHAQRRGGSASARSAR
jgi:sugar transferase (PEP-CTERM/EpsH1 system associated)